MSYISDYIYDYSSDYMYDYSYDPTHSHNQIIILINYKKGQLVWVWEEVMDAGMIPCL